MLQLRPTSPRRLGDDIVLPFRTVRSGVMGRLVRLGSSVDTILSRHDVPVPVAQTLGEAVALTALLGTALKFDGKLIVQTKTDGIVDFLVVNFEAPGRVRGYVRYDKKRLPADGREASIDQPTLLGSGHLAITIDQGEDMERYQGIVALSGEDLGGAAQAYFRQSEQLPSFLRLAVARHYQAGANGGEWHWRAGGLMLQNLARDRRQAASAGRGRRLARRGRRRLGAHADPCRPPSRTTSCSTRRCRRSGCSIGCSTRKACVPCRRRRCRPSAAARASAWARSCARFGAVELADMREPDGTISVTCEFCTATYRFAPNEFD